MDIVFLLLFTFGFLFLTLCSEGEKEDSQYLENSQNWSSACDTSYKPYILV